MSSEIWQVGQKESAQELYKNIKKLPFLSDVKAVKILTDICNKMNTAYDEVLADQNEYLVEIESEDLNLQNYVDDTKKRIETLLAEVRKLEQKEQDGTITEEEQRDLDAKKGELDSLIKDSGSQIKSKSDKLNTESEVKSKDLKSKENIARNYGEVTVEKGTPLAETKVSHGFFKKLFGTTGANKKEAGEKAVEAGNNLLYKVNESVDINEQIDKHRSIISKTNKL